jgi:hypothetical protein
MKRSLTNVPVISLYVFERIQKMCQAIAKNSYVVILTRKRSIDPEQTTLYNINKDHISLRTCGREMGCPFEPGLAEGFYILFHQQRAGSC